MAENQQIKRYRVLNLPSSGLVSGTNYELYLGGGVYRNYVVSDSLQLVAQDGKEFIECDTMAEMRALDSRQIWAIQNGYYKGVTLNGYYSKEDTPAPINYVLSDTAEADDGGSVIEVGDIKLEHNFSKNINILYFGAIGDNSNDDTASIQKAANYCSTLSYIPVLVFPEGYSFRTTNTVIIPHNIHVLMNSPISYQGSMDREAVSIGSSNNRSYHHKHKINVTATNMRSDWSNDNYIGCILINQYSSEIIIEQASFFTEGVRFFGDGDGFVYNNITLKDLGHNHIQAHLYSRDSGWCNQNCFYGGRMQRSSHINRGQNSYGFKLSSNDGYRQNANRIYNTSIELNDEASRDVVRDPVTNAIISINNPDGESVPILIENGRHNKFEIRDEGNTYTVKTDNDSHNNEVQTLFSRVYSRYDDSVKDVGLFPSTKYISNIQTINQELGHCVINVPNIYQYVNKFNSTSYSVLSPFKVQNAGASNPTTSVTGISTSENTVIVTEASGLGIRIDTRIRKRFNVALGYNDINTTGRIYIVCRDIDGVIIPPDTTTAREFVRNSGRYNTVFSTRFGSGVALDTGIAGTRDLGNIMQFFEVRPDVKYVDLYISGYQGNAEVNSISIYSLDGECAVIPYLNQVEKITNELPTDTSYAGDFRFSTSPDRIGYAYKLGSWREVGGNATPTVKGLVNQSTAVANSSSAIPATDSDSTATDVAGVVTDLNDLISKYNSLKTVVSELQAQLNAKLEADRASGQQAT